MARGTSMSRWALGAALAAVVLLGAYWWSGRSPAAAPTAAAPAAEQAAELVAAASGEPAGAQLSEPAGENLRVAEPAPTGVAHLVDLLGRPIAGTTIRTARDGAATEQSTAADGSFRVAGEGRSALELPADWDVVSVGGQTPEPASMAELPRAWLVQADAVVVAASLGDVELTIVDKDGPSPPRSGTVYLTVDVGQPLLAYPMVNSKASIRAPSGDYYVVVELANTLPQVLGAGQKLPVASGGPRQAEIAVLQEAEEAVELTLGDVRVFSGSVEVSFALQDIPAFATRRFDVAGELRLARLELRGGAGFSSYMETPPPGDVVVRRVATLRAGPVVRTFVWKDGATLDLSPTSPLSVSLDTADLPWTDLISASLRDWNDPETAPAVDGVQTGSTWHWGEMPMGPHWLILRHGNGNWIYETPVMLAGTAESSAVELAPQARWGEELHMWNFGPEPGPADIVSIPFESKTKRGGRLFGTATPDTRFPVLSTSPRYLTLGGQIAPGLVVLPFEEPQGGGGRETRPNVHTLFSATVEVRCENADGIPLRGARVRVESAGTNAVYEADLLGGLRLVNCAPGTHAWLHGLGLTEIPLADKRLTPRVGPDAAAQAASSESPVLLRAPRTAKVLVAHTGDFRPGELVCLRMSQEVPTGHEGRTATNVAFERWLVSPGSVTLREVPEGEYVLSVGPANGAGGEERRVQIAAGDLVRVSFSESDS